MIEAVHSREYGKINMGYLFTFISILAFGLTNQRTNLPQKTLVEQGSPDELKGVMKVFVDTNMDKLHRADIVKEIQKKLPALEIVTKPEDANIHLKFSLQRKNNFDEGTPGKPRPVRGAGKVVRVVSNDRVRLLLEYEEDEYRIKFGKRNPAEEFAKEFVKAYLAANGKRGLFSRGTEINGFP